MSSLYLVTYVVCCSLGLALHLQILVIRYYIKIDSFIRARYSNADKKKYTTYFILKFKTYININRQFSLSNNIQKQETVLSV